MTEVIEVRRQVASRGYQPWKPNDSRLVAVAPAHNLVERYRLSVEAFTCNAPSTSSGRVVGTMTSAAAEWLDVDYDLIASTNSPSVRIGKSVPAGMVVVNPAATKIEASDSVQKPVTAASTVRVRRLTAIQAMLGLTTKALADVLNVTRPTLYKWLDTSVSVTLHESNLQRLAKVERLTKQWNQRTSAPLSAFAQIPLEAGGSVVVLMSHAELDEPEVTSAFDEVLRKAAAASQTLSQRRAAAGYSRRPSLLGRSDDDE